MNTKNANKSGSELSRKDAIKKAGKYAAFTAAASIILLTPARAQDASDIDPTGSGFGSSSYTPPGGGGGGGSSSTFTKPKDKSSEKPSSSQLKDSPWK